VITISKMITGDEILSKRGWSEEALIFACEHEALIPWSFRGVEDATISELRFAFFDESSVWGWERFVRTGIADGWAGNHFPTIGTPAAQAIGPDEEHEGAAIFKDAPSMVAFQKLTQRALGALFRGTPDDDDHKAENISAVQRALGLKKK
jgi:hypothetical protein